MPIANSYVPPPAPFTGPVTKTPVDVQPGVATSTTNNTPTPVNTIDNTPPVTPGVATSTEPPPPLPNAENFNLEINLASLSVTPNQVITASAVPFGSTNWIQYNNSGSFGANANLQWAQNGLWVGGVSTSLDASGIITAKNDFRAGAWKPVRFGAESDAFSRFRFVSNAPNANTSYYGFNSDYQVIKQQCTVVTNENVSTTAMVLMEGIAYNEEYASVQPGTIFGISVNNGYLNNRISTGNEYGWQRLMQLDNWGTLSVGGNISIKPNFNYIYNNENPNEPGRFGIVFADGSYQWHAPVVQEEGTNVVSNASIFNFVGAGVTASNANGIATITIPGGSGTSSIAVQEEGTNVVAAANTINFVGSGVTASNVSGVATITISSGGISGIAVQEEGTNVVATTNTINFVGSGVTASNVGNVATITITSGGISGIAVQEEGTNVLATANTINFVGSGVTASNVGNVATITITSGGISGVTVQEEGTNVLATANAINFVGSGVTASNVGNVATITITSGGISGIDILANASPVTANATAISFNGPLANVANVGFGNATDVTIGLTVQDESNVITGNAAIGTLNFLGAGVTATAGPNGVANITIPGGTGVATVYNAGSNSTVTLDYNNGQWQTYTPDSGTLNITVSNIPTGGEMTIFLQTGGSNTTVSWLGVLFWENGDSTPSATNGVRDIITIKNQGSYTFGQFSKLYIS